MNLQFISCIFDFLEPPIFNCFQELDAFAKVADLLRVSFSRLQMYLHCGKTSVLEIV